MFWLVELDDFSLKNNEVSSSEFWDIYVFGIALGSLSFNAQGCVPYCWRISMICLALELVGSWVDLGFSVGVDVWG